MRTCRGDIAA